jgi:hypothetical protein
LGLRSSVAGCRLVHPYYSGRYEIYAAAKLALVESNGTATNTNTSAAESNGNRHHAGAVDEDLLAKSSAAAMVQWACNFARDAWNPVVTPAAPTGDPVKTARALWTKYAPA